MKNPSLSVEIGKLKLKNPLIAASGTFGYAQEFQDLLDLRKIGAIITKTITLSPRKGNPPPRTVETPSGMLNSIGLENPGIDIFLKEKLPFLKRMATPIIVSIMAENIDGFKELAKILDKTKEVMAIELNLSCPNITHATNNTKLIAQDPKATYEAVEAVRSQTHKTLIAKLSPNVTDITEIARVAISAGADALSLINTFFAMAIDIKTKSPALGSATGGLSGPAIKPIALYMVWQLYKEIKSPIIACGGIMTAQDAIEFMLAGANAVAVGTANFINPRVTIEIIEGLKAYLIKNKIKDIKILRGAIKA